MKLVYNIRLWLSHEEIVQKHEKRRSLFRRRRGETFQELENEHEGRALVGNKLKALDSPT
jgi:hypothetical protein